MSPLTTALLIGAGALGVGYLIGHAAAPTPATPKGGGLLPPIPNPQPQPGPLPPATNADALRAFVAQLLAQAATNPQSVDPTVMDQAAAELDSIGLTAEAAAVRQAAVQVRLAQGGQLPPLPGPNPIPVPVPPGGTATPAPGPAPRPVIINGMPSDRVRPDLAEQMRIVMSSPNANPAAARHLAAQIQATSPGAVGPITTLHQYADHLAMGRP